MKTNKILVCAAFIAVSLTSFAQVGVGTTSPDASAALDVESTTKGFLPPRMTEGQINAIATPAEGLIVYCLDCTPKGLLVNNGTEFVNITGTATADPIAAIVADATNPAAYGTPSLADLAAVGVTDLTGTQVEYEEAIADASPAPTTLAELQAIIDAVNAANSGGPTDTTTTVVVVAGQNGTIWMDRNLGATQQATSSTDAASYGDLYQWGRAADGHQIRTSSTVAAPSTVTSADPGHGDFILTDATTDNNWTNFAGEDGLWQSGLNDPCPTGYRIPTETELNNERSAFSPNNAAGAASSALALPAAGYRYSSNGTLFSVGSGGYWSSTVSGTYARALVFISSNAAISARNRALGYSVRCIQE